MTETSGTADSLLHDLPDTPAGHQMNWFLTHSGSQGTDLTVDEVAQHMAFPPPWTPEEGLTRFQQADGRPARIAKIRSDEPHSIEVLLDYGDDKPWNAAIIVEQHPPP